MLVGVSCAVLAVVAVAWATRSGPPGEPGASGPTPAPSSPGVSAGLLVESEREVFVDGSTVEVLETSRLVEGAAVQVTPPTVTPLGLELLDTAVVAPDGRVTRLSSEVALASGGSITVRGRYRLTGCPDVLPTVWPSPADFPGAARTYSRLDEPQHTVAALCPEARSKAVRLEGLTGTVAAGGDPRIRLSWDGAEPLTVTAVGAAATVAAVVPEPSCTAPCVTRIPAGGAVPLLLQPVDPCPPATRDDELVLVVAGSDRPVTVRVPGLHRAVCR